MTNTIPSAKRKMTDPSADSVHATKRQLRTCKDANYTLYKTFEAMMKELESTKSELAHVKEKHAAAEERADQERTCYVTLSCRLKSNATEIETLKRDLAQEKEKNRMNQRDLETLVKLKKHCAEMSVILANSAPVSAPPVKDSVQKSHAATGSVSSAGGRDLPPAYDEDVDFFLRAGGFIE